jgi:glycosyltransferase involved in cell wall biosynthesis
LVEKPIMRRASGLIALTPDEIDSYRALGIETPCHVVPNGIDVAQFRRTPRMASLSALDIKKSDQVILFLGRLHPAKGVDLLVDAFFRIASRHPDALLVIAGPDEHGFAEKIRSEVARQDLEHRILIPGMVMGDLKTDLLARADLFVLPSMGEGSSMAILEALASGTPVIISPECNCRIVDEVKAGAVVERDANLIAQAISRFLSDKALSSAASEAAYNLARDRLGWPSIVDKLERIYLGARQPVHPFCRG